MKSTGIVRKVDSLGRIVLPKELRTTYEIEEGTPLEIYTEGNKIILTSYINKCVFCDNEAENMITINDRYICKDCLAKLQSK